LIHDLLKLCSVYKSVYSNSGINSSIEKPDQALENLIEETFTLMKNRKRLSIIFDNLASTNRLPRYREAFIGLNNLAESIRLEKTFSHQAMTAIYRQLSLEVELFALLLHVQVRIAHLQLLEAVTLLYRIKQTFDQWRQMIQQEQTVQSASTRHSAGPSFSFHWLSQLYEILLSKCSFYFSNAFKAREEEIGGDSKTFAALLQKNEVNFSSLVESFAVRSDALNVSLFVDGGQLLREVQSEGEDFNGIIGNSPCYMCCFESESQVPSGLRSYPAIFSVPKASETPCQS